MVVDELLPTHHQCYTERAATRDRRRPYGLEPPLGPRHVALLGACVDKGAVADDALPLPSGLLDSSFLRPKERVRLSP